MKRLLAALNMFVDPPQKATCLGLLPRALKLPNSLKTVDFFHLLDFLRANVKFKPKK